MMTIINLNTDFYLQISLLYKSNFNSIVQTEI